jgi:putative ABC transport system substrate-binding protein
LLEAAHVKRLESLHETHPAAKRIGLLIDPAVPSTRSQLREAARKLDLALIEIDAPNPTALADAFDALASAHLDAVNVLASPLFSTVRHLIIERLNQARLPAMYQFPEAAREGGLLAYGASLQAAFQQIAALVTKILRGARPEDLPIENIAKIDFIVNLKTAKALSIEISPNLLAQADEAIE